MNENREIVSPESRLGTLGVRLSFLFALAALILFLPCAYSADVVKLPVIDRQDIRFIPLTVDGKSLQDRVITIAQDNYGFLWLGSRDGLYRYDGYSLKRYQNKRGQLNGLSSDPVRMLCKDKAGFLWVGTSNEGLYRLDPALDTLTHFQHEPGNSGSLSDDGIRTVYQDRSGVLWIGTGDGLDRLDQATGTFAHYRHNPQDSSSLSHAIVESIYEDRQGNFWVGTGKGLNKLDRATGRFARFLHDPGDPHSLGHDYVGSMLQDRFGVLWLGGQFGDGLCSMDVKTGRFTRYSFHAEEPNSQSVVGVNDIFEDRDGVLWVPTVDRGLLKLDGDRTRFLRYARDANDPSSLPHDSPLTVFEDSEGTMWVGTLTGLCRFQSKPPPFVNYRYAAGNPNSLRDNVIRSVQVDSKGFLWIGTEYGLDRLDRKTGKFTFYQHNSRKANSLAYDKVAATVEDRSGLLWFGTYGGGLDRFDPATGQFFAYRHEAPDPHSLSTNAILSLLLDHQGTLWVGTQDGGLNRFDPGTGRFTAYRTGPHLIYVVYEDRAGLLRFGGQDGGLNRFDPRTEQITVYRHNPRDPATISVDNVHAICEDREGILWIGTPNGLNRLDRNTGRFTVFTTNDGLPGNVITGILEDAKGYLWLSTNDGLSRFDPRTKAFRNYSESDGLPSNFLNPYFAEGSVRTRSGEIIIGSTKGVTTFYPGRLSDNPYVPPVVLTDFRLFNKSVFPGADSPLHQPIWAANSLTLTHSQSIFMLEFAALSYAAPENNRYRYRLEGLDPGWNEVDSKQRFATYTSLPAGTYTFRVQASNNDGVWNQAGATLVIRILPPWWQTWWFLSVAGLSITGMAAGAYRSRVRGLHLEAARLEAQVAGRTRELRIAKDAAEAANRAKSSFLAKMSHELRTPLNAILGFSALLREGDATAEEQRRDLDIIRHSGEHLLNLIDDILDLSKIEAGRHVLEISPCNLTSLVHDVTDMMRRPAEEKDLKLSLVPSPGFPQYVLADGPKLRQVLINLLGNAIKYTETGSVTLRLNAGAAGEASVLLAFDVEDTGPGIAFEDQTRIFDAFTQVGNTASRKGTGLGLAITRQFVELMGGSIQLESAPGKGSRFRVDFPVELAAESAVTGLRAVPDRGRVVGLEAGQPEYRILIAEDNRENIMVLERLLRKTGFQVLVATDGQQAVELFSTWHPHLIFMDVRLPIFDGIEATRRIRLLEGGREVKIVALTASVFADQKSQVLAADLDDFTRKPYTFEEIFDCLARHLDVRYIRSEPTPAKTGTVLRPESLSAIPEVLRHELADTVITLNRERILEVIGRISKMDAELGAVLARFGDRLEFTAILNAVEGCGTKPVAKKT